MRRRRLLAALGAGTLGAVAGCGYAYGGGDLRGEESIYASGFGTERYALAGDRIVVANSGRIVDHDRGGFHDGTSVTVTDLTGIVRWRHTHWELSVAVSGADPVYLLDEQDRVVALAAGGSGSDDDEVSWQVAVDGARPELASDSRGAYVAVDDGVAAVRDGDEIWRVPLPGPVVSLQVTAGTIVAATSSAVVALAPTGEERWRRSTGTEPSLDTGGGRVAIHDGRSVVVTGAETDEGSWSVDGVGSAARPTVTEDRAYLVDRGGVSVFDAETGDRLWEVDTPVSVTPPVVPAPEGAYAVGGRCRAIGLDEDGTRWTRQLSVGDCGVVGGWLDGEQVAFLFESGDLRRLQRTDQDRGLL